MASDEDWRRILNDVAGFKLTRSASCVDPRHRSIIAVTLVA